MPVDFIINSTFRGLSIAISKMLVLKLLFEKPTEQKPLVFIIFMSQAQHQQIYS